MSCFRFCRPSTVQHWYAFCPESHSTTGQQSRRCMDVPHSLPSTGSECQVLGWPPPSLLYFCHLVQSTHLNRAAWSLPSSGMWPSPESINLLSVSHFLSNEQDEMGYRLFIFKIKDSALSILLYDAFLLLMATPGHPGWPTLWVQPSQKTA